MQNKLLALLWGMALLLAGMAQADAAEKTILLIESYHADYPWDASYKSGLQEVLQSKYTLKHFEMNTKRLPTSQHREMAELAWKKYQELKPDLVIIGDDAGLSHLGPRFAQTTTPVVYLGINNNPRNYFTHAPDNITGILERPIFKRSILSIKSLLPRAKNVLVLFDTDVTSQIVRKEAFQDDDRLQIEDVNVEIKLIGDLATWQETILAAKGKYDACVAGLYQNLKTRDGKHVDSEKLITWTSNNTPVPLFAFWDFAVGRDKAVGGVVLQGKEMGVLAGGVVRKILEDGIPPRKIPPYSNNQGVYLFSRSQLDKWSITLPEAIASRAGFVD